MTRSFCLHTERFLYYGMCLHFLPTCRLHFILLENWLHIMLHFKPHIVEVLCLAYLDFILGYNVASIFTNLCYYNFNPKANVCVNGKILKKVFLSSCTMPYTSNLLITISWDGKIYRNVYYWCIKYKESIAFLIRPAFHLKLLSAALYLSLCCLAILK